MKKERNWICEVRGRYVKTLIVKGINRKDAKWRANHGEGEGINTDYYNMGPVKVICADGPIKRKAAQ